MNLLFFILGTSFIYSLKSTEHFNQFFEDSRFIFRYFTSFENFSSLVFTEFTRTRVNVHHSQNIFSSNFGLVFGKHFQNNQIILARTTHSIEVTEIVHRRSMLL